MGSKGGAFRGGERLLSLLHMPAIQGRLGSMQVPQVPVGDIISAGR